MSALPSGWTAAPLGALGAWGSGGTPSKSVAANYQNGTIPWLVIGDLNDGLVQTAATSITPAGIANSSAKLLPPNTLLVAMYGSIGKLGITGIECATNQAIAFCRPHEGVDLRYLFRVLQSARADLQAQGQGGTQLNISQTILKAHEVPLAPLREQKRIADKLDSVLARVDACRDRLDRIPALLKRFRQSILAAATSGRLTENWRTEHNAIEPISMTLRDVIKVSSGNFLPAKDMTPGGTIPVYGGNGVNGYHDQSNVSEETLLIGRVGYYCGSVHMTPKKAWVTDNALIVNHDPNQTSRKFLYYALQALDLRTNDSSTAQPVISGQKIYPIELDLPSLSEQHEVVRRVETLFAFADRLEARLATARKQASQLTPALLAKAFRGELVPQDPKDEPATELLKRLATQRNAAPKATRGRKPSAK